MSQPSNKNQPRPEEEPEVVVTSNDIVFDCTACKGELVVDREGEGMALACSHCGAAIVVPLYRDRKNRSASEEPDVAPRPEEIAAAFDFSGHTREQVAGRIEDLKLQLQENEAQRVETRGHVNRTTLQLHRYQLQMDKLVKRQRAIESELKAALERLKAV
jgi:hypothetical protein